jgi:TonB-dependent receptor
MTQPFPLARLMLYSTAAFISIPAIAQEAPSADASTAASGSTEAAVPDAAAQTADAAADTAAEPGQSEPEVSIPGAAPSGEEIIVRGRRNVVRSTPEVVSVLSTQDIARTGEGNIAGSLQRVTGLSVVGSGFVYVRGLGDRYSLALLNGLPLPSPEPLRRVIPLDLFPANLIDSTLVQKSFSANFPGEFGGGVINLTTKAIPAETFLNLGFSGGFNTETTDKLGYTYYGSSSDWLGFDDGARSIPRPLRAALQSGNPILEGADFSRADLQSIAISLANANTTLLQRNRNIPANWSGSATAGTSFDAIGGATVGVILTGGISNRWRTRDTLQQLSVNADLSGDPQTSYQRVITDNRVVVNGMLGVGVEAGEHKFRFTNLFIRDALKQARLGLGSDLNQIGRDIMSQDTAWYERQLFNTQLVGELEFGNLSLDLRGGYANSRREAPYERNFTYVRSNLPLNLDPVGNKFVNDLGGNRGGATFAFSKLNENLYAAGADVSYRFSPQLSATVGYAFSDTQRRSERRAFQYRASNLPVPVQQLRPDYLVSDATIQLFDISLLETSAQEGTAAFDAGLRVHGGYGQVQFDPTDFLKINAGVRYERARQSSVPIDLFNTGASGIAETNLENDYWLPGVTVTFRATPELQIRLSGSKTIARPQFRELIAQIYQDPESNRTFRGNPSLTDSELLNADLRAEYYFGSDQRVTGAVFYKKIDRPIEAFTSQSESNVNTSFANAPTAKLYGAEVELQKYFPLEKLGGLFGSRRGVLIGNYTYTSSKLQVGEGDETILNGTVLPASQFFMDGSPLTGQSDHLANVQLGLEDGSRLSQQTLLLGFASKRVTQRGPSGQPDVYEYPGVQLDFVAREGLKIRGREVELKFEARNLLDTGYREFQEAGDNRIYFNRYRVGRTFSLGGTVKL